MKIEVLYKGYCLKDFPAEIKAEIKDSLTFSNPKYVQAKKYSKWNSAPKGIPRELRYYEIKNNDIYVPYGFNIEKYISSNVLVTEKPKVKNEVLFPLFKLKLRQTQEEALIAYFNHLKKYNNYGQIVMPTGKGKAQPLYSKIMTPNGYSLMGEIKIGDEVFDSKGNICHITGVFPQGKKKVYELTFSDGSKVRSSDEHLWFVQTRREYRKGSPFNVKTLNDIMNMELRDGRSYNLIFPKNGVVKYKDVEHKIHPYVLGCIIGDGCMTAASKGIVYFSNTEQDVINRLNEKLTEGYFDFNSSTQCQYQYRIKENSKRGSRIYGTFIQEILRLGLDCKSKEKFIPMEYLLSSEENRRELLYGLFDTDGCVIPNGSFMFSTTSKQLAKDLVYLCRSLGIIASFRSRIREDEGKSNEFMVYIRTHEKVFTSKKHNSRYEKAVLSHSRNNIQKYDTLRLVDIKYIGEEECQCIMVDSEDHSYLTDDFVVTHNTILALAIAAYLNVKTLIVVHKTDLLKVWEEDIKLALDTPVGIIQGANKKVEDITVAMVQTLNSMKKNGEFNEEFLNQFDLIIVDEAHHCPASTYDVIENFNAKYRIGLTATPERNDGLTHVLNLFFGSPCYIFKGGKEDEDILPVKVKIRNIPLEYNPIIEVTKEDLFKQLVSIKLVNEYPKDFNLKLPINTYYLESLRGVKIEFPKDFNRATMERSIVNNDYFFHNVMLDLSREIDLNHSCILFFKQKEEVDWWYDKIRMLCKSNFYPVKYYGNNSESENKEILQAIENGVYNITLTTLAKCSEGTNCKAWESVFLISSIGNGKDVEQAVGRARRVKEGKNPIVNLYDYRFPKIKCINKGHSNIRDIRYKELKFIDSRIFPNTFSLGYPSK